MNSEVVAMNKADLDDIDALLADIDQDKGTAEKSKKKKSKPVERNREEELDDLLSSVAVEQSMPAPVESLEELPATHPDRLTAAKNKMDELRSEGRFDEAARVGKVAFDDAISQLDMLCEDSYKGSTLIMQEIRDRIDECGETDEVEQSEVERCEDVDIEEDQNEYLQMATEVESIAELTVMSKMAYDEPMKMIEKVAVERVSYAYARLPSPVNMAMDIVEETLLPIDEPLYALEVPGTESMRAFFESAAPPVSELVDSMPNNVALESHTTLMPPVSVPSSRAGVALADVRDMASCEGAYAHYLAVRDSADEAPSFFVDVADELHSKSGGQAGTKRERQLAARVLSTVCELKLADAQLYRVMAYRLEQLGAMDQCVNAFERARRLRREEPQSWRDEALARLRRNAAGDWQRAVQLMRRVVESSWQARHAQIELIVGVELAHALTVLAPGGRAALHGWAARAAVQWRPMPCDLRIVCRWTVDDSDVELSVRERASGAWVRGLKTVLPSGGVLSRNFTSGLGPQEFVARRAAVGGYDVYVRLHQRTARTAADCVTVGVHIFTNYGRPGLEDEQVACVRLSCDPCRNVNDATLVATVHA